MQFKYLKNRFNEMMNRYVGYGIPCFKKMLLLLDFIYSYIIYGASISDYFTFAFYKLNHEGRKEYITYRKYLKIQKCCNDSSKIEICRNKALFNRYFSDYIGRQWLDINECTYEEFSLFIQNHPVIFAKEVNGFRGIGVSRVDMSKEEPEKFYARLRMDKELHYIIEEEISQSPILNQFHPWSINTIRIVTLYDDKNDVVHVMKARIRIGNNMNNVDNLHYNGIGANIDISSGIIDSVGRDSNNNKYICHPITGTQIVGFKIPYWLECVEYAKAAAKAIPQVRYIGWDIVIRDNGSFLLIEANDNADHDFQQIFNGGLWYQYKSILERLCTY